MWDKSSWPERAVVIWGLLIASSAVLYVAVSLSNVIFENSSNIASWVQAIGSIVAIAATAIIARRDGLHRKNAEKEKEEENLKKAKYYLQQADVLNSLEFFQARWKMYDKLCINGYPENVAKLRKIYFFKITNKSFFQLSNSIDSMTENRREIILTGEHSHIFLPLFEIVGFYKKMYIDAEGLVRGYPSEYSDEDFTHTFDAYEFSRISRIEGYFSTQFEGVMKHKGLFFEKIKELFTIAR